jgi:hypothetical protein
MPIHEHDPWRTQYFEGADCPPDVCIPTDDMDGYSWNPRHRWIYNKILVAESQGLVCAPHGLDPPRYPVFSKPIVNLQGMGVGTCILRSAAEYEARRMPGHMWMSLLEGEHISTDIAVVDGDMRWSRHTVGLALPGGTFDYWTIEADPRPALESYCRDWIAKFLGGYTGMLNVETLGGRIIDAHLRFADQWPDLYGVGWLEAMVRLYAKGEWTSGDFGRRTGYSVVLFGPHGRRYSRPPASLQADIRRDPGISSLQITFYDDRPTASHAMPPGGFRLAVINAWDLCAAQRWRDILAYQFAVYTDFGPGDQLAEYA